MSWPLCKGCANGQGYNEVTRREDGSIKTMGHGVKCLKIHTTEHMINAIKAGACVDYVRGGIYDIVIPKGD